MHELRIAEDLSVIVLEAASREGLSSVTRVSVTFGVLVQIVPEIFESAFREVVRHTPAEDAMISIETVAVKLRCRNCGRIFSVNENLFACTYCGSSDSDIINGKELYIKSIEGE